MKKSKRSTIKMVPGVNFGGVEVTDDFAFFLYLVIFQIFYIKKKKKKA